MKNTSILLAVICALLLSLPGRGQSSIVQPAGDLIGHWEGAFIKNNAYQKIDIQFFLMGESLFSLQIMEEWHPQFGEFQIPVGVDSNGTITLNTGLGKAIL